MLADGFVVIHLGSKANIINLVDIFWFVLFEGVKFDSLLQWYAVILPCRFSRAIRVGLVFEVANLLILINFIQNYRIRSSLLTGILPNILINILIFLFEINDLDQFIVFPWSQCRSSGILLRNVPAFLIFNYIETLARWSDPI